MWYIVFFIATIPPIILSIVELKTNKKLKKKKLLYWFSISLIITSILNLSYTPYDKYNSDLQIDSLDKRILKLKDENKLLYEKNALLDKNIQLLDKHLAITSKDLKKFKSHISQFSVFFYVGFKINSKVNIANKENYLRLPMVGLISHNKTEIGFSQSPPSYELNNIFEKELVNANYRIYSFVGVANVEGGGNPIGRKLEILKDYTHISIYIPMYPYLERDDYGSRTIEITSCNVSFTINGIPLSNNIINCPKQPLALLGEYPDAEYKNRFATVQFKLPQNLYEELKLDKF